MTNTPTPTAGDLVTVPRSVLAPFAARANFNGLSQVVSLGACKAAAEALAASPALPAQSGAGMRENARLQDAMLVLGAYLLEKGEEFRVGEGAELVDAYNAAFSDPKTNDAPAMREALENLTAFVKGSNNAEGYCMCGSPMDDRAAHDNHTAVDIGEYHAEQLIQQAQAALSSPAPEGEAAPNAADRAERLMAAIEGECEGLAITDDQAAAILRYVDGAEGEAAQGVEPVTKALEWVKHPTADMWRAETILGFYEVSAIVGFLWQFKGHAEYGDALEATDTASAFAAAQADFDRRIRSALAPPSVNQEEAGR